MNNQKWYQKPAWIIVLLVLFFPLGLFLMWKYTDWDKKIKIGITLLILFILMASRGGNNKNIVTKTVPVNEAKVVAQDVNIPQTDEEKIKAVVNEHLHGDNNMKKPALRDLLIEKDDKENWLVIVDLNADDNLGNDYIKKGIQGKMTMIYKDLFHLKTVQPIAEVTQIAYFPLKDKYGKVTDDIVYTTKLSKSEADKVNWNDSDATLKYQILPAVWTVGYEHPQFAE